MLKRDVAVPLWVSVGAAMLLRALAVTVVVVLLVVLFNLFLGVRLVRNGSIERVRGRWGRRLALAFEVVSEMSGARGREMSGPQHWRAWRGWPLRALLLEMTINALTYGHNWRYLLPVRLLEHSAHVHLGPHVLPLVR